jgi:hypothetical protein
MNYSQIISYIYALLAVGLGTYFCIIYINYYNFTYNIYNNRKKAIGIIKTINCYDKNSCHSDIEFSVNDIKYALRGQPISNNLKIGDKIEVIYNPNDPNDVIYYETIYIYAVIYIILLILLIICILLLWIFLFIVILFENNYNKFIFLFYSFFITIFISYHLYIKIHNNLYGIFNAYDDYEDTTMGIIKSNDQCFDNTMCYSIVEYLIDDVKHNVKILTFDRKVGEEVKVYYNKDYPDAIKLYDKNENKQILKAIIYIIIILLLWIFLIFNISFIYKGTNK